MTKSESVKEIAPAFLAAQQAGDRFFEGLLIPDVLAAMGYTNRPHKSVVDRFYSKIVFGSCDCWYWAGARDTGGYGMLIALGENKAHRVSYRLHIGNIEPGLDVLHRCDVRCCVNPEHLFVGTHTENMRDMVAKGRWGGGCLAGEDSPQSKLTAAQVQEMRNLRAATGMSYRLIAERFGVQTMTAQRAVTGTSWKSIGN